MSNTPAIAGTDQRAMVSDALLQKALAGRTPEQITALLGETAVSAIVAAQTPPATPAASEEEAGEKPMKKGKGNKKDMEAEDGDYEEEDDMSASLGGVHGLYAAISALAPTASLGAVAKVVALAESTFAGQSAAAAPAKEPSEEGLGAAALASAIRHNNANLGGSGETEKKADSSTVWDRAIASNNPNLNR